MRNPCISGEGLCECFNQQPEICFILMRILVKLPSNMTNLS